MKTHRRSILDDLLGDSWPDMFFNNHYTRVVTSQLGSPISHVMTKDGVEVTFQVPGYDKDELELTVEGAALYVTDVVQDSDAKHSLSLSFGLPEGVDPDTITSKCEKGILTVTAKFEKPEKEVRHTIKIG